MSTWDLPGCIRDHDIGNNGNPRHQHIRDSSVTSESTTLRNQDCSRLRYELVEFPPSEVTAEMDVRAAYPAEIRRRSSNTHDHNLATGWKIFLIQACEEGFQTEAILIDVASRNNEKSFVDAGPHSLHSNSLNVLHDITCG